ncbi:MAG TPA: hypothetical protein VJ729_09285 [Nitrososphaeraceae archaeon]|jgi:hypothetical protein|nr:hypothetical protein [Nitrososphaeraceae archaeon]
MGNIADKVKEKVMGAKDKVTDTTKETKDKISDNTKLNADTDNQDDRTFEEGGPGTETGRKDDPLTEFREKEPMTPAKIKEHEPTAVKREMTEHIIDPGKEVPNPRAAEERARKSGMAKGTAGSAETGSEYEQGAAGTN